MTTTEGLANFTRSSTDLNGSRSSARAAKLGRPPNNARATTQTRERSCGWRKYELGESSLMAIPYGVGWLFPPSKLSCRRAELQHVSVLRVEAATMFLVGGFC